MSSRRVLLLARAVGMRRQLTSLLSAGGFEVQACATARETHPVLAPELAALVVHLELEDADPVAFVRAVSKQAPNLLVLALSPRGMDERVIAAVRGGVRGCLYTDDVDERLLPALNEMLDGGRPMSRGMGSMLFEHVRRSRVSSQQQKAVRPLTPRESEVLGALARGMTYDDIAEWMGVSLNTVRSFVRAIYEKLDVHSRVDAVLLGMRLGLVKQSE